MENTKKAKVFVNGRSQAVRLPMEFRFKGKEVEVRRDEATGGVLLLEPAHDDSEARRRRVALEEFFALCDAAEVPKGFMTERDQGELPVRVELGASL